MNPAGSKEVIEDKMEEAMENYNRGDEYEGVTIAWNFAQNTLKCCGVDDINDWPSSKIAQSCYKVWYHQFYQRIYRLYRAGLKGSSR